MDFKLELVPVPVSDVDRAIAFYRDKAGFHLDQDHTVNEELRFVQLTPPGSACSIAMGKGIVDSAPGSIRGLQMVVADIHAARAELLERGVDVGEVQTFPWGKFVYFSDPDGLALELVDGGHAPLSTGQGLRFVERELRRIAKTTRTPHPALPHCATLPRQVRLLVVNLFILNREARSKHRYEAARLRLLGIDEDAPFDDSDEEDV